MRLWSGSESSHLTEEPPRNRLCPSGELDYASGAHGPPKSTRPKRTETCACSSRVAVLCGPDLGHLCPDCCWCAERRKQRGRARPPWVLLTSDALFCLYFLGQSKSRGQAQRPGTGACVTLAPGGQILLNKDVGHGGGASCPEPLNQRVTERAPKCQRKKRSNRWRRLMRSLSQTDDNCREAGPRRIETVLQKRAVCTVFYTDGQREGVWVPGAHRWMVQGGWAAQRPEQGRLAPLHLGQTEDFTEAMLLEKPWG